MNDIILRSAEERDLSALESLTLELRESAEIDTPSFQADFHKLFSLCIEDPKCHIIVAERARGQDMGRALVEEVLKRAQGAGCVEIEVSTGFDNEPAQSLYRSQGFEERGLLLKRESLKPYLPSRRTTRL